MRHAPNLPGQTALAAELAGKAGSLSILVEQLESRDCERSRGRRSSPASGRRPQRPGRAADRRSTGRRKADFPILPELRLQWPLPRRKACCPNRWLALNLASFDQKTVDGDVSQGLSIATRAESRVVSPSDGWVIYAGPFRSYGQFLIINAGEGYNVVLAGMSEINVELGQFVLAGEPVGVMGERRFASNSSGNTGSNVNVDLGSLRPVLYVEFRKDGNSIDPSPWWAPSKCGREKRIMKKTSLFRCRNASWNLNRSWV